MSFTNWQRVLLLADGRLITLGLLIFEQLYMLLVLVYGLGSVTKPSRNISRSSSLLFIAMLAAVGMGHGCALLNPLSPVPDSAYSHSMVDGACW